MSKNNLAHLTYDQYYHMMADRVRMQAFHKAIKETVQSGDIVIDLGCGLGILGIWALQAGASHVYSIEQSDSITLAQKIAHDNKCADEITFIQDHSGNVELPVLADVLISETLGSFGIDENCLYHMLDVRKRLLKPNARMIPHAINLFAAPVSSNAVYDKIDIWNSIEGINLSSAFDVFAGKLLTESVSAGQMLGDPIQLTSIDLGNFNDPAFKARVLMHMRKAGVLHGVATWFEAHLSEGISINTGPSEVETHWKQGFFPFREQIEVIANDVLEWTVEHTPNAGNIDHSQLRYEYRCTQLKHEASFSGQELARSASVKAAQECPCGSGYSYQACCGVRG